MNRLAPALAAAVLAAAGCAPTEQPVPPLSSPAGAKRADGTSRPSARVSRRKGDERPDTYTVQAGDTLFNIALDFGFDYRELASWNRLADPARIYIGQKLRLSPPEKPSEALPDVEVKALTSATVAAEALPVPPSAGGDKRIAADGKTPVLAEPRALTVEYSDQAWAQLGGAEPAAPVRADRPSAAQPAKVPLPAADKDGAGADEETLPWAWPAKGDVLYRFGEAGRLKGIGIGGKAGQPVVAAADGKVVYSGTGLRGYGRLVIVKHNDVYISVYAHNSALAVREGDPVRRGQKIAEMGDSDATRVTLHFEVRRFGKPIDPMTRLGAL